ncbi:hypothetical protein, partial [Flavonifractor plautii]|uniref:hypothetical protein n=1 Tax=Flavonifractor plautii TaxID=292800 RepID=UPI001D0800A4
QPLFVTFSVEKVTQKHFHTAAPLGRQYESAFARSRGGSPKPTGNCNFPQLPADSSFIKGR